MSGPPSVESQDKAEVRYTPAELTTLAHLYRGEMYRSKVWRTRLDTTTNWAVATTGIALSVTFSNADISPVPLLLVALLVSIFLGIEARRYRYFDIWRTRVRLLEVCFYGPLLVGEPISTANRWNEVLAQDYRDIRFHINFWEAAGRRLRRNYIWIFLIIGISYLSKITIHPRPVVTFDEFLGRAAMGPLPGAVVLSIGLVGYVILGILAVSTISHPHAAGRVSGAGPQDVDPREKYGIRV